MYMHASGNVLVEVRATCVQYACCMHVTCALYVESQNENLMIIN